MDRQKRIIRNWIRFFIGALLLSGITAIPVESELAVLTRLFPAGTFVGDWLDKVYSGLHFASKEYPFLFYGYDWLAFAHFVIALLFIGPLKDPVKNKWVIEFAMITCILIIPYALIAGQFRGIPFWWRLTDCSFGIAGLFPLGICLQKINRLEDEEFEANQSETKI